MRWLLLWSLMMVGCGDNDAAFPELPMSARCVDYEAMFASVDAPVETPSIVPAQAGVRIIVRSDFVPFMGSSYPVPGGRMVWNVWIFRWYDGDHLGAIGRKENDLCEWDEPL